MVENRLCRLVFQDENVINYLTHSVNKIITAIVESECGAKSVTKDFLKQGMTANKVVRGVNNHRRKCTVIRQKAIEKTT